MLAVTLTPPPQVHVNIYKRLTLPVTTQSDQITIEAVTYQMLWNKKLDDAPSKVYMNVIIRGAIEHQMERDYVKMLCNVKDNGNLGNDGTPCKYQAVDCSSYIE